MVKSLPSLMNDCAPIAVGVASLEIWASEFLDTPADLEALIKTNIPHRLIKMKSDLNEAKQNWDDERYFAFGTKIGEMLVNSTNVKFYRYCKPSS